MAAEGGGQAFLPHRFNTVKYIFSEQSMLLPLLLALPLPPCGLACAPLPPSGGGTQHTHNANFPALWPPAPRLTGFTEGMRQKLLRTGLCIACQATATRSNSSHSVHCRGKPAGGLSDVMHSGGWRATDNSAVFSATRGNSTSPRRSGSS